MLSVNDELGTGGHGQYAYPGGAPIVSADEVVHFRDRHGGKFKDCSICFPNKGAVKK